MSQGTSWPARIVSYLLPASLSLLARMLIKRGLMAISDGGMLAMPDGAKITGR
jgi:hypothetical protein